VQALTWDYPTEGRPPPAGPGAELGGAGVGLGVADEPPHPLQPRLRRPRRAAVVARKAYLWWDVNAGRWTGHDVPDFPPDKPPDYRPPPDATGYAALAGTEPFITQADGKGG
jgi:hypothetical protein